MERGRGGVIRAASATVIMAGGSRLTLRVPSEATGGAFGMIDFEVAPSFVAPPIIHRHTREDWWGHVTEGELAIDLDGEVHRLETGATVFVPRGVGFRWWNPHPVAARWTLTWSPGGFERYFEQLAAAIAANPPSSPAEVGALAMPLWERFGLTVGPRVEGGAQ